MKTSLLIVLYLIVVSTCYYIIVNSDFDVVKLKQENQQLKEKVLLLETENQSLKDEIKEIKGSEKNYIVYQSLFAFSVITIVIILILIYKKR